MTDEGYINYYEILDLEKGANPGEVRKTYKRKMKALVSEIARVEITADRRSRYLLQMAQLNAAVYILRDKDKRDLYWRLRQELGGGVECWTDVDGTHDQVHIRQLPEGECVLLERQEFSGAERWVPRATVNIVAGSSAHIDVGE